MRTLKLILSIGTIAAIVLVIIFAFRALDRPPTGAEVHFMGEVVDVTFGEDWSTAPAVLGYGGLYGRQWLGPQEMVLLNGNALSVPAGTPGGNMCVELLHPSIVEDATGVPGSTIEDIPLFVTSYDWSQPCLIMGGLNDDGTVQWYQNLSVEEVDGRFLAEVGSLVRLDTEHEVVLTSWGVLLPAPGLTHICRDAAGARLFADWSTGNVVLMQCYYAA